METQPSDTYQLVTNLLLKQSEQGTLPWQVPWSTRGRPYNLLTKMPYRGINVWLLNSTEYPTNCYATHRQIRELHARVMPRETAHIMVCQPEANGVPVGSPTLCKVYNVAQCEGIPKALMPSPTKVKNPAAICEEIVATMPERDTLLRGVSIGNIGTFDTAMEYYDRLFRLLVGNALKRIRFDVDMPFAHMQLAAQMGAAYLISFSGFDALAIAPPFEDVNLWRALLRKNSKLPLTAAHCAQVVVDNILGHVTDEDLRMRPSPIATVAQKPRSLKVYCSPQSTRFKKQPMIRLAGNYLKDVGFAVGDRIEIALGDRQITISKM